MRSSAFIPSSFSFPHSTGAMNGLRKHFTVGLVLIMCTLTSHCSRSAPSVAPASAATGRDAQRGFKRIVEIMRHVEESRSQSAETGPQVQISSMEPNDLRNLKTDRRNPTPVIYSKDHRKKEFLKHITGPLSFGPKCRKQVYRIYHHTRDCAIPAFFKRCARLLTQLAGKLQCKEG
ncbi:hypothetical protein JOB18_016948 [Solea senegalensis]|nr:hypothetical protein JOB18_016948 [Solea senegalensis]KAG7508562.1 hypothetical protein JOB18_016948 [Solea senegalensis]